MKTVLKATGVTVMKYFLDEYVFFHCRKCSQRGRVSGSETMIHYGFVLGIIIRFSRKFHSPGWRFQLNIITTFSKRQNLPGDHLITKMWKKAIRKRHSFQNSILRINMKLKCFYYCAELNMIFNIIDHCIFSNNILRVLK